MKSILNIEVSCFANYDTPENPKSVNLLTWLQSNKYCLKVEKIRSIEDKQERDSIKAKLPAITPSGVFTYRSIKSLVRHSGFIQFDIDLKGNEAIRNFNDLKEEISKIKNVAYCGLSVSGKGCWGLIPISNPDKHYLHFTAMRAVFQRLNIAIDPAPKSVASLRGYSYDPNAYYNHSALVFEKYYCPPPLQQKPINTIVDLDIQKIFEIAGRLISEAKDGEKWIHLSKASYLLGGYAASSLIDAQEALAFLKQRIEQRSDVKSITKAFQTIEKCFVEGSKQPIYNQKKQ